MDDFRIYQRDLPHWRESGVTYFVTWRLHRGQPLLQEWERSLVANAILHFQNMRYELDGYVVMDDHVHVMLRLMEPWQLEQLTHSWKSFTAHRLQKESVRKAPVWQKESFDRIVRDKEEWVNKISYIAHNPLKRWPDLERNYQWMGGDCFSK